MAKKNISVCTICGKEDCDGIEYKTEDMWGAYGFHIGVEIVCKNSPGVRYIKGKLTYKVVSGFGEYNYYYVFPASYSDAKVKEEARKLRAKDEQR